MFVTRRHGQREYHLVLDQLPDIHRPGCEHAVYFVVCFLDLPKTFAKLQFDIDRKGKRNWTEAALAH